MVTIRELADHAGVSIKTVSRVVNNDPTVKERNRKRVQDAITHFGYRPNIAARMLRSARSFLVALIYENPDSPNLGRIQAGILQRCRAAGYHLIIEHIDSKDPDRIEKVADLIIQSAIEGAILLTPASEDVAVQQLFREQQKPFVAITPAPSPGVSSSVGMDDCLAAKQATMELARLGHRRIAFIKNPETHPTSQLRFDGYRQGLEASNLVFDPNLVGQADFTVVSGSEAAQRLLALPQRPTAIFAGNDDLAIGAMLKAEQLGVNVPQDLSVLGFDDTSAAALVKPTLSSVRQPVSEMAETAASQLLEQIEGGTTKIAATLLTGHEFKPRNSTAPRAP